MSWIQLTFSSAMRPRAKGRGSSSCASRYSRFSSMQAIRSTEKALRRSVFHSVRFHSVGIGKGRWASHAGDTFALSHGMVEVTGVC